jgi:hypothetical protein
MAKSHQTLDLGAYGSDTDEDGIEDYRDVDQNTTFGNIDEDADADGIPDSVDFDNSEQGPYFVKVDVNGETVPFNADPEYFECIIDVKQQVMWPRRPNGGDFVCANVLEAFIDGAYNDTSMCGQDNWGEASRDDFLALHVARMSSDSEFIASDWEWTDTRITGGHRGYFAPYSNSAFIGNVNRCNNVYPSSKLE